MSHVYERFLALRLKVGASPGASQKLQGQAWSPRAEDTANLTVPLAQETVGRRRGTRRLSMSGDSLLCPSLVLTPVSGSQLRGSQSAQRHVRGSEPWARSLLLDVTGGTTQDPNMSPPVASTCRTSGTEVERPQA